MSLIVTINTNKLVLRGVTKDLLEKYRQKRHTSQNLKSL